MKEANEMFCHVSEVRYWTWHKAIPGSATVEGYRNPRHPLQKFTQLSEGRVLCLKIRMHSVNIHQSIANHPQIPQNLQWPSYFSDSALFLLSMSLSPLSLSGSLSL